MTARWRHCIAAALLAVGLGACSGTSSQVPPLAAPADSSDLRARGVAVSQKAFANRPEHFQFAVVGDRTGGHRPGVFARAMAQLNLLQPEFVLSVGDHIEGYSEDRDEVAARWSEVEGHIDSLQMPYFFVPGNHDISNPVMLDEWRSRHGRAYYHFRYRDVLFLVLSTEDPPTASNKKRLMQELGVSAQEYRQAVQTLQGNPAEVAAAVAADPRLASIAAALAGGDSATLSEAQVAYMSEAVAANRDVRWTFVLMHKPAWKYDAPGFLRIEEQLQSRPYTVLAGHFHYYSREQRFGRDYIQMGTTGGNQRTHPAGPGTLDHLMWVTVGEDGPEIANIALDGLFDREGPRQARTPLE
ncbi:metallophosphoesterase family protein [Parahaliea aestuarii]|uniref:Metallophosphoesterase n=1 Tax=Parahaliea aestuarii TaxID=1852021 RepID=A0A5C9A327_9GAMM|nr:metallophosphoesterase [Parahaliea aestuarii]TXS94479.1 metallophosphoesterase [Parahaliea aestuarii]